MARQLARAYCPKCGHRQTFERHEVRHLLHLLFSILTCGLWLVSWVALSIGQRFRPWSCEQCGYQEFGLRQVLISDAYGVRRIRTTEETARKGLSRGFWATIFSLVLIGFIGYADLKLGPQISVSTFYFIAIYIAAWSGGTTCGILVSLVSGLTYLGVELSWTGFFTSPLAPYVNAMVRTSVFLSLSVVLSSSRKYYRTLESNDADVQAADKEAGTGRRSPAGSSFPERQANIS